MPTCSGILLRFACNKGHLQLHQPHQLLAVSSMEPASYYKCLDDPGYMSAFNISMVG